MEKRAEAVAHLELVAAQLVGLDAEDEASGVHQVGFSWGDERREGQRRVMRK